MSVQMNIERQPVIQRGNLTIDPQCCTVLLESEDIDLFLKEFDVLLLLVQYPGWVFSKKQIYETVWNESGDGGAAVTNEVSQIRRKIGNRYIKTVIGSGYKFEV